MRARTILITLGFCSNKVFKHTASRLMQSLSGKHEIEKYFIAKPYPIDEKENYRLNCQDAENAGYAVIKRTVDSGAAGDFNKTLWDLNIQGNDIVICYDADIYPVQDGWDDAMIKVFQGDSFIDWVCLWNNATSAEFFSKTNGRSVVNGVNIEFSADWMMAGVSGFRGSFLKATGGLVQPRKYYGGVEQAMWDHIVMRETRQAFLVDYHEDQRIKDANEDPLYRDWKTVHVQKSFPVSFKDWLEIPR